MAGCPATGSVDWLPTLQEVWGSAARAVSLAVDPPPVAVFEQFRLPLLAGLIPAALQPLVPLPQPQQARFLRQLHLRLAHQLAERLRRREAIISAVPTPSPSPDAPPSSSDPLLSSAAPPSSSSSCPLPPERQLLPVDLRRLEVQRRNASPACPGAVGAAPAVPPSGDPRRWWLRSRLERVLNENMVPCSEGEAVTALTILAVFETMTTETFADTPGVKLASRVAGMGRMMSNVVREVSFDPPLRQFSRRGTASWDRQPLQPMDVAAWRAGVLAAEQFAAPVIRTRRQMTESNEGLLDWVRQHRYLTPADVNVGESGMALLLLWEVDHARPFPTHGGAGHSAALVGFTRRLKSRVDKDAELSSWLTCQEFQRPLVPGLPAVYHMRWSVKVLQPPAGEPQGWYTEFVRRWRDYLEGLANSAAAPAAGDVATSSATTPTSADGTVSERIPGTSRPRAPRARRAIEAASPAAPAPAPHGPRPKKKRRANSPAPLVDAAVPPVAPVCTPPGTPVQQAIVTSTAHRQRPADPSLLPPPKRRHDDLRQWLRPTSEASLSEQPAVRQSPLPCGHGRATEGPPT